MSWVDVVTALEKKLALKGVRLYVKKEEADAPFFHHRKILELPKITPKPPLLIFAKNAEYLEQAALTERRWKSGLL